MGPIINIPDALLVKYYGVLSKRELRLIISTILKTKTNKLKKAHVYHLRIPHIGHLSSHASKKRPGYKKRRTMERKKKRIRQKSLNLKKEKLLF
jgi:hypothetical protein